MLSPPPPTTPPPWLIPPPPMWPTPPPPWPPPPRCARAMPAARVQHNAIRNTSFMAIVPLLGSLLPLCLRRNRKEAGGKKTCSTGVTSRNHDLHLLRDGPRLSGRSA